MEPTELLGVIGEVLDRIGCARFTTGSVASMVYGEPRFTNDIDIVVRMDDRQARKVAAAFTGEAWYVSLEAAVDAVRHRGMFNVIHVPSGLKVDLIVAANDAYSDARFDRVRGIRMPDGRVEPFSSPEDVVLMKLLFFQEGGSDKHRRDIATIIAVQGIASLDWEYMAAWSDRLGVAAEFEQLRRGA